MAEKRLDLVIDPTQAEQGGKRVKKVLVELQKDAKVLVKSFEDANTTIGNSKKILDVVTKLEKQIQKTGDAATQTEKAVSSYDEAVKRATSAVQKNYDTLQLLNTETGKELVLTQQMVRERKNSIKTVSAESKAIDDLNKEYEESQGKLSALQKGYGQHNTKVKQSVKLYDDLAKAQEKLKLTQSDQYRELQQVNAEIDRQKRAVNESIGVHDRATNSARNFERSLMGVGIAASMISGTEMLGQLVQTLDKYTELQNKIAVVTGSTDNLAETTRELLEVSLATRTSLEATTDLYSKLTRVNERFGMSQREVLDITTTVSQAVAMSGASSAAAEGAVIQFAQALAGDFKTAGQELNSILEQTPGLAKAVADGLSKLGHMGEVSSSQLKKLAADGLISTDDVLNGLKATAADVAKSFESSTKTISQAQDGVVQSFIVTAGEIDKTAKLSKNLVTSLDTMSTLMKENKEAVAALGGAFAGLAGTAILGTTVALVGLISAPWLLAAAGITAAGGALGYFMSQLDHEDRMLEITKGVETLTNKLKDLREMSAKDIDLFSAVDMERELQNQVDMINNKIEEVEGKRNELLKGGFLQAVSGTKDSGSTSAEDIKELNNELSGLQSQLDLLNQKKGVLNELFGQGGFKSREGKSDIDRMEEQLQAIITSADPLSKVNAEVEGLREKLAQYRELLEKRGVNLETDKEFLRISTSIEKIISEKLTNAVSKNKDALVNWNDVLKSVTRSLQGQIEAFGLSERSLALLVNEEQAELKVRKAYDDQLKKGLITQSAVNVKVGQAVSKTRSLTNELFDLKDALKQANKETSNITDISELFNKAENSVSKFTLTSSELDVFKDKARSMLDGTIGGLERYQQTLERLNSIEVRNPLDNLTFNINSTDLEKQLRPLEDTLDVLYSKLSMKDLSKESRKNVKTAVDNIESEIEKIKFDHIADSFEAGLSGLQKMSSEGSSAFRALGASIDVVNGIQAINAVLTQGSGDPYTAFARMATMAGIVASMGYSVGSLSGGDSGGAARAQELQGTGSVLGDTTAKSESILKASEITANATSELVGINRSMLDALENLQAGISGAVTMIARGASDVNLPSGSTPMPNMNVVGTLGAGVAGGYLASGITATTLAGSINAGISTVFGPAGIIAGFALSAVDDLLNGALSKVISSVIGAKVKGKDTGIRIIGGALDDLMEDTITQAFSKWRERKNWLDDYDDKEVVTALDQDVNKQFALVFEGLYNSVKAGAETLKLIPSDVQEALDSFTIETMDISLKDLDPAEQQEALSAVFSEVFDGLAGDVVPYISDFQMAGEGLGETLSRVASNVSLVDYSINKLNIDLPETSESLAHFSTDLIDASGGFEEFSSNVSAFVKGFKTDAEQFDIASEDLLGAFNSLGFVLPKTKSAFVSLVESISDPTKLASVLSLSKSTEEYFSLLEDQTEGFSRLVNTINSSISDTYSSEQALLSANNAMVFLGKTGKTYNQALKELSKQSPEDLADLIDTLGISFNDLEGYINSLINASEVTTDTSKGSSGSPKSIDSAYNAVMMFPKVLDEYFGGVVPTLEEANKVLGDLVQDAPDVSSYEESLMGMNDVISQVTGGIPESLDELNNAWNSYQQSRGSSIDTSIVDTDIEKAIVSAYKSSLGRLPDTSGFNYWVEQVESGAQTLEGAIADIERGDEAALYSSFKSFSEIYKEMDSVLQSGGVFDSSNFLTAIANYEYAQEHFVETTKDTADKVSSSVNSIANDLELLSKLLEQLSGATETELTLEKLGLNPSGVEQFITDLTSMTEKQLLKTAKSLGLSTSEFVNNVKYLVDTIDLTKESLSGLNAQGTALQNLSDIFGLGFSQITSFIDQVSLSSTEVIFENALALGLSVEDYIDNIVALNDEFINVSNSADNILSRIQSSLKPDEFNDNQITQAVEALGVMNGSISEFLHTLTQDSLLQMSEELGLSMEQISGHIDTLLDDLNKQEQELEATVNDALKGLSDAIEKEKDILKEANDTVIESYNNQITSLKDSIRGLEELSNRLRDTIRSTAIESNTLDRYRRSAAKSQLNQALVSARAGMLPLDGSLDNALTELRKSSIKFYTDFNSYARDQASVSGGLSELDELTGDQLSIEKRSLNELEDLVRATEEEYELQVKQLDETLEKYDEQINQLRGIDSSVLSVEEAVWAVESAIQSLLTMQQKQVTNSVITQSGGGTATTISYSTGHTKKVDDFGYGQTNVSGSVTDVGLLNSPIKVVETNKFGQGGTSSSITDPSLKIDGNFRTGVVVPRDNFLMNAHEGERLLSAQENRIYSGMIESGANETALLRKEVSQMRREMNIMLTSINQHSSSTANNTDTLRRWERNPGIQTVTTV